MSDDRSSEHTPRPGASEPEASSTRAAGPDAAGPDAAGSRASSANSAGPREGGPDEGELSGLLARARSGDVPALDRLLRLVEPRIRRWALAATGSPTAADEVAQDALVRVYRHLAGFAGRSRFTTWVYRVVRSAAAERARRGRRHGDRTVRLPEGPERAGPERSERAGAAAALSARVAAAVAETAPPGAEAVDRQRLMALVRAFFAELPERQREIFDLADLQGYAPGEIAGMLDMKPVSVRASLFKARRAIRRRILETRPELVEDRE